MLFTCSAFGEAIEGAAAALAAPVLKFNEPMFDVALTIGGRIGMLATFAPAVTSMEDEFRELAYGRKASATLETALVRGAREALMSGETDKHDHLIAQAASELKGCNAIMLAHFGGRIGPSHAYVHMVRMSCDVNIFGMLAGHDAVIHADVHCAVVIPARAVRALPKAIELVARREKVILERVRAPGFNARAMREARRESGQIR